MRAAGFFTLVTSSLLLAGCPREKRTETGPDAPADAAPPLLRRFTIDVVGRTTGHARFMTTEDRRLWLDATLFVYAATNDGTLQRIGEPKDYAPMVPELSDDLAGYDAHRRTPYRTLALEGEKLVVTDRASHEEHAFLWDGTAWKPTTAKTDADLHARALAEMEDAGVKPAPGWSSRHRLPDGRFIFLYNDSSHAEQVAIVKPGGATIATRPITTLPGGGVIGHESCEFIPSARDEDVHLACSVTTRDTYEWSRHVLRLEGEKWTRLDLPASTERSSHYAVDREGGLWFGEGRTPLTLVRRAPDGTIEKLAIPRADFRVARPSYRADTIATQTNEQQGYDKLRYWVTARIESGDPGEPSWLQSIAVRPSGDIWFLVGEHGFTQLVVRASREPGPQRPVTVGSDVDQENQLRSEKPPRAWVGHCPQLFVRLARAKDLASLPIERLTAERNVVTELTQKFAPPGGYTAAARLVTGTLGGEAVAGVVLIRSMPDAKEADLEKTARAVVERFTTNPASPPPVFCSLPVLDRLL